MKYPEKIKKGDLIGVTAPSAGLETDEMVIKTKNAIKNIENLGFKVKLTSNCMPGFVYKGRSSNAKQRAKEFMDLYRDEEVKAIIFLSGGDFMCEIIDLIDFDELKRLPPKWIQGYSDCTNLCFLFPTLLDTAAIYGNTFKSFGMNKLHESLTNSLKLMEKQEFKQNSYDYCEEAKEFDLTSVNNEEIDPLKFWDLTKKVNWKILKGGENVHFKGRCLGGCLDIIREVFIGTKYDKVKDYIEKYKEDGIIWFLESFETNTPAHLRTLWQMKNSGYFENCKRNCFWKAFMCKRRL